MGSNQASDSIEAKQALAIATSNLEKPMDINQDNQKKWFHIPNNITIQEPNVGSPETGTLEQK